MESADRICPVCGQHYKANPVRLRHGRQTTCSRECSYKLRAAKLANGRQFVCPICGKKFYRSPSEIKSKHQGIYCSPQCHYAGRSIGLTKRIVVKPYILVSEYDRHAAGLKAWRTRRRLGHDKHSEATKERLRQATIKYIAHNVNGYHVSALENRVAQELTRFDIPYIRQFPIRNPQTGRYVAVIDFLIDDKIALEVNGTFWHADPRFYPDGPIFDTQKRTANRYAVKSAILKSLGLPLIEVWESDLEQNFTKALRGALPEFNIG